MEEEEQQKSKALFITLDPERDKVEMMQEYTGFFHSNIIGLTDTAETISEVAQSYGVTIRRKSWNDLPSAMLSTIPQTSIWSILQGCW